MTEMSTGELRRGLLGVHGIGEETADSILCYGFSRPSFVIDAYTGRMVRCAGVNAPRNRLKPLFEGVLPKTNEACRQTHAHIVEYAKEYCGKKRCDGCILVNSNG
jgi:endonuclease III related protein